MKYAPAIATPRTRADCATGRHQWLAVFFWFAIALPLPAWALIGLIFAQAAAICAFAARLLRGGA